MTVVLITGASSGIGAALAREYGARGAKVALLARRVDRLEELARELPDARAIACDVTQDGDLERAVEATTRAFGRLDVAVANAGFGVMGSIERLSLDDYRRQFETNVFGVIRTVRAALPALKERRGRLAVVGSVNGFVAFPATSAYAASKFAVRGLCEALGAELAPSGVSVTHVAPGFVESEIRNRRGGGRDPIPSALVMPARAAAREIVRGIEARRPEVIVTGHGKAGVFVERHLPSAIRALMRLVSPRMRRALDDVAG